MGFLPWLDAGFYQRTLYAQDWICLANAQHPRVRGARKKHWSLAVYQQEAHIASARARARATSCLKARWPRNRSRARYHHDAASRWLRGVCAELFLQSAPSP